MSTKKKSQTPSMFAGLFRGAGRNRKGNFEDMIYNFMIQDSQAKDSVPEPLEKQWSYSNPVKKVKPNVDANDMPVKPSVEIPQPKKIPSSPKLIENHENPEIHKIDLDNFRSPSKEAKGKTVQKSQTIEQKEMGKEKVTAKPMESKKRKSSPKPKSLDQSPTKKRPKKKKVRAYMTMEERLLEDGLDEDMFPFDDNQPKVTNGESDIPYWLKNEHLKDANGRGIDEEDYDPTTLSIPIEELEQLPSVQRKYWEFKSKFFDKIVAFKMWQSHFLYGNDALLLHKICDTPLGYHKGNLYTHCSDRLLYQNAPKLLELGHKIVVLKPPPEWKQDENYEKHTREVSQILTRGTFVDNPDMTYDSVFCLCIFERNNHIGIVYFDSTTHEFYMGEFKDDPARNNLRTIVTRIKPAEVVYLRNYLNQSTKDILESLPSKPSVSQIQIPGERTKPILNILEEISQCFVSKNSAEPTLPEFFNSMKNVVEMEISHRKKKSDMTIEEERDIEENTSYYYATRALSICYNYLKDLRLVDEVFALGSFKPYDLAIEKKSMLYLDSQALQNLEVLEVDYMHRLKESRSLFGYMDKTVSPFGKRMFRKWLISPLLDVNAINERQQAIEDLADNEKVADYFQSMIKDLPDIERIINRIYNLSSKKRIAGERYQEFVKNKLLDFLNLLEQLEQVEAIIERFEPHKRKFKSKRLTQLVTFKDLEKNKLNTEDNPDQGFFPKVGPFLTELKNMVLVKDGLLVPAAGVDQEVDRILAKIEQLKETMQFILEEQKRFFQNRWLKFSHTKQRYEIEVPEEVFERIPRPKDYAITSKRKGFVRIHTPQIEEALNELINCEFDLNAALGIFIERYFRMFYEKRTYWQQIVSCLSELDCLCGLAKFKKTMKTCCRPIVLPQTDKPVFELRHMVHPCIAPLNPNFVPNDFLVEDDIDTYLITGPNMGGKSTLLRQICLAVIMAQIGSFVPASSFRFSVIDRIFTRIGASDRLVEEKSTFFVELEETYTIMTEATKNSLIIIDELGRGTSTYDGVSIAYATLKYIAERIRGITLFATHYHLLLDEFKLYKNVANYNLASEVNHQKEELKFKYKFVKGQCNHSHGVIIAKMAGISQEVCQSAKEASAFMTNERRNIGFQRSLADKFNKIIEELERIEENEDDTNFEEIFEELHYI